MAAALKFSQALVGRAHRCPMAAELLVSLGVLLYLIVASFGQFGTPEKLHALNLALLGGAAVVLATATGR